MKKTDDDLATVEAALDCVSKLYGLVLDNGVPIRRFDIASAVFLVVANEAAIMKYDKRDTDDLEEAAGMILEIAQRHNAPRRKQAKELARNALNLVEGVYLRVREEVFFNEGEK